ncbi:MAG: hypothetical protein ACP5O0_04500 [Acidimicrobiales bacterium]
MTAMIAIGVTVLVLASLTGVVVSLMVLREARATLNATQRLFDSLQRETIDLVKESTTMLVGTREEMARAQDLVELSEVRSQAYTSASRLALHAVAAPIIRFRALRLGIRRGVELFRSRRKG